MIFRHLDRIVFAGDSVTDSGRARPLGEGAFDSVGFGYVRILENMLSAYYPETLLRITNAGISGDTSRDLLRRFDADVVFLHPDWVSICIGINDVWSRFVCPAITDVPVMPDEYEKNVEEMVLRVKDQVRGIFLLSPYIMEPNRSDPMRRCMDEYVSVCKRLAEKHGCRFVDFQNLYEEYCTVRYSSHIALDRIHPNQIGATLMAREFLNLCDFDYFHKPEMILPGANPERDAEFR